MVTDCLRQYTHISAIIQNQLAICIVSLQQAYSIFPLLFNLFLPTSSSLSSVPSVSSCHLRLPCPSISLLSPSPAALRPLPLSSTDLLSSFLALPSPSLPCCHPVCQQKAFNLCDPGGQTGQTGLSALSVPRPIKTNKQHQSLHKVIPPPLFFSIHLCLFSLRLVVIYSGTSGQVRGLLWASNLRAPGNVSVCVTWRSDPARLFRLVPVFSGTLTH